MANLLKGKEVVDKLNDELLACSEKLAAAGNPPTLGILRLGERPDDMAYERGALKRAEKTGVTVKQFIFDENMSQDELISEIEKINKDNSIHGLLMFRPLPSHIDDEAVRNVLAPEKDVDGITDGSMAGVYSGEDKGFPPCTAEACIEILDHYGIDVKGKNVAVIGRSQVIGKPVSMMLIKKNATVTVCHTKTENMASICKDKDVIIAAAGHKGTVTADFLSPGQTVIDVAINFDDEGNMCGDVDFPAAEPVVDAITPVPGGVGAVTTSMLMKHVIEAAEKVGA
ncbi:MAG: bifunctional 5,10-methylenetetrahydrofolate dehydrogenase/5,10-methenyltetrahydrofolate cyclohydrolase [Firmicutes bacterium]|nr:bifunctional 5,10-methylenetetrahydrofolate dehydrogenase/5,10-methenyltetrahydrofolate cyclohydrolase [Bacillota bacterium]